MGFFETIMLSPSSKKKFGPKSLSGLVIWLRADLGITLNSGNVSSWADQSGNGNNLTQGTASQQPLFVASGSKGKPYVKSDGVNDVLASSGSVWPADTTTLVAVLSTRSGSSGEFFCDPGVGGDSRHHFYGASETAIQRLTSGPSKTLTSQTTSYIVYTASGLVESLYLNGGSATTTSTTRPGSANNILNIFAVGAAAVLPRSFDLYEFMIYNRVLSATEISKINAYCSRRYI